MLYKPNSQMEPTCPCAVHRVAAGTRLIWNVRRAIVRNKAKHTRRLDVAWIVPADTRSTHS